jgi:peptidoglycan/LPS O-acetylase OafA/YrhL
MRKIESLKQVQALIGDTYMYAAIVAIAALALVFIIANTVKFGGGKNSADHITRRIWFIVIGIVATVTFYLYNSLYVSDFITKAPLKAQFATANIIASIAIVLLGYIVVGIVTMFLMRRSKWGSILGKSK